MMDATIFRTSTLWSMRYALVTKGPVRGTGDLTELGEQLLYL
jgi:hypothetical protein